MRFFPSVLLDLLLGPKITSSGTVVRNEGYSLRIDPIYSCSDFSIRKSRKAFDEYLVKAKTPLKAAVHNRALSDN